MSPQLHGSLRYWVEYLASIALVYTGLHVLQRGDLVGLVPFILGIALLFISYGETRARRARARAAERVQVPSIQDDGSLR